MSRLRRPILHSRFFFVTTNLRKGLRPFNQPELELLTDCLARVRERVPVSICAYCMMPDHLHAILFVREGTTISDVMMRFKIPASRRIRPLRGHGFWQRRFYDRALRTRGEYDEAFDYIHHNPVHRGLVQDPLDWRWSSARWVTQRIGLIEVDEVRLPLNTSARI